jgi:hypothetical protein
MIEMCKGCGRPVLVHRMAGLTVKADLTSLDGAGAVAEIMGGRQLWMVERNQQGQPTRLRGARPGEPGPVREHHCRTDARQGGCAAVSGPGTPPAVPALPKGPQSPSGRRVAPSTRSSGPQTDHSSARPAASPRSDSRSHPCDACKKPVLMDGPELYIAMELGATVMWAVHDECSTGR